MALTALIATALVACGGDSPPPPTPTTAATHPDRRRHPDPAAAAPATPPPRAAATATPTAAATDTPTATATTTPTAPATTTPTTAATAPTTVATATPTTAATATPTAAATTATATAAPTPEPVARVLPEGSVLEAPPGPFTAIAVGYYAEGYFDSSYACALTETGEATCWDRNFGGQTTALPGRYIEIVPVFGDICGVTEAGQPVCQGRDELVADAPPGRYRTLSVTDGYGCALTEEGEAVCWGRYRKRPGARPVPEGEGDDPYSPYGPMPDPPPGAYVAVSVISQTPGRHSGSFLTACAEKRSGGWACWQSNGRYWWEGDEKERVWETDDAPSWVIRDLADLAPAPGQLFVMNPPAPPSGAYKAISARGGYGCALTEAGEPVCWKSVRNVLLPPDPPLGRYLALSDGHSHTCALTEAGEAACWGWNNWGQTEVPAGRYTAISAGGHHTCALTTAGEAVCWGLIPGHPPEGQYKAISTSWSIEGGGTACALTESDSVVCWGAVWSEGLTGQYSAIHGDTWAGCGIEMVGGNVVCSLQGSLSRIDQLGSPMALSMGGWSGFSPWDVSVCTLTEASEVVCWNLGPDTLREDSPSGRHTAVAVGFHYACALTIVGDAVCWGWVVQEPRSGAFSENPYRDQLTQPPPGPFIAISASEFRTCALTEAGEVVCWGDTTYEETPPSLYQG